mmetsp:Transcript_21030/g.65355  ORF Transcript_21030/g.65355 Transcript_21030/m.65355 type:complete len:296 (+) Transcript_21030:77-964(+)
MQTCRLCAATNTAPLRGPTPLFLPLSSLLVSKHVGRGRRPSRRSRRARQRRGRPSRELRVREAERRAERVDPRPVIVVERPLGEAARLVTHEQLRALIPADGLRRHGERVERVEVDELLELGQHLVGLVAAQRRRGLQQVAAAALCDQALELSGDGRLREAIRLLQLAQTGGVVGGRLALLNHGLHLAAQHAQQRRLLQADLLAAELEAERLAVLADRGRVLRRDVRRVEHAVDERTNAQHLHLDKERFAQRRVHLERLLDREQEGAVVVGERAALLERADDRVLVERRAEAELR